MEEWKSFPDEDLNFYQVSNLGRIRNTKRKNKILRPSYDSDGYPQVILQNKKKNKKRAIKIHRAVMITFEPIKNMEGMEVNHIDGVKINNMLINLEWCTREENIEHAKKNNLYSGRKRVNPKPPKKEKEWNVGDVVSW
jgi:hypothetical protein